MNLTVMVVKLHIRILFLIICCFILSPTKVLSQEDYLHKKISINIVNETIESSLRKIESAAGCSFSFNSDIIRLDSVVSINSVNKEMINILISLLGDNFIFKSSGNYIIILKKKKY